jgi:hypothetical protein
LAGNTGTQAPGSWSALQTLSFTPTADHASVVVYLASSDITGGGAGGHVFFDPVSITPEPSTFAMLAFAGAGAAFVRRRKMAKA